LRPPYISSLPLSIPRTGPLRAKRLRLGFGGEIYRNEEWRGKIVVSILITLLASDENTSEISWLYLSKDLNRGRAGIGLVEFGLGHEA
jgi:hypothetical protein